MPPPPAHAARPVSGAASRVLVVDDSPLTRRAVARMLEREGYRVTTASSGEEAFELCATRAFDLVVTDQTMGALSGSMLCRLLRADASTSRTPVVILAADHDRRSQFWARDAGADAYVRKEDADTLLPETAAALVARADRPAAAHAQARATPPMERLCAVLDDVLFRNVVAGEVRKLVEHVDDRGRFATKLIALVGELADHAYLTVRLLGPMGPTFALHVRGPWPDSAADGLAALRDDSAGAVPAVLVREANERGDVVPGPRMELPIVAGHELLGDIVAYGGRSRLGGHDERTLHGVAAEIGVVTKSLFLVEETHLLAHTDSLTALANRRAASERLDHEIERAARHGTSVAVALCDVDHFKRINDRFGHATGDAVLRRVADVLAAAVRRTDLVGRWGGEEMLVILPNAAAAGGRVVAERLRALCARDAGIPDGPEQVTISVGVAAFEPEGDRDRAVLLARADEALYRAKQRGRNRVETG